MEVRIPAPLTLEGDVVSNWKRFKQNFEIYLLASGKSAEKEPVKVAVFLNIIGDEGLDIYNNFKISDDEKQKLVSVLKEFENHLVPKRNEIYERFLFYKRIQGKTEPIHIFIEDLKKLVKTCNFGDQSEKMIRDRIVLGVHRSEVQEKLSNIPDLTLDKAAEICKTFEVTKQQVKNIQGHQDIESISHHQRQKFSTRVKDSSTKEGQHHYSSTKEGQNHHSSSKEGQTYFSRCGGIHVNKQCPAIGKTCYKCGKPNHFSNKCFKKRVQAIEENLFVDSLAVLEHGDFDGEFCRVDSISNNNKTWFQQISVGNENITFKLDTGSEVNVLPTSCISSDNLAKGVPTSITL
ncbi:uncharacterized protein LOC111053806 isoform X1 [Nilaparvata lugens]|uniref:uncharacterized protein LOC111053806 isoform X1 n=1 Tax=Nilaparvata lugens TaxID=108931 RepID=UPI00193DCAC8|nr:uncharacterized protein LOC111053806 isoform X1 [Nilaparvata lugens]